MTHIDCSGEALDYFDAFTADARDRSETAMTQNHVYEVCRLSIEAQTKAATLGRR